MQRSIRMLPSRALVIGVLVYAVGSPSPSAETNKPALLPRDQETALALSAAPAHLRSGAAVYVLRANGFVKIRESSNHFSCIVNRENALDLRPTCYDAEGTETILPKVIQIGAWLMAGKSPSEITELVADGFKRGRFIAPRRPGIAYMLSEENRKFDPWTGAVAAVQPHVMFYAPNLTNADIGSNGGRDGLPFIADCGPHGFMIMMPSKSD
jgi:hypothetical protein